LIYTYNKHHKKDNMSRTAFAILLVCAAFFFANRSCEYLKVPVRGKTKLLVLGNIKFTDKTGRKPVNAHQSDFKEKAHYVSITYVDQKSGKKMEVRSQVKTDHEILCPVALWGEVYRRVSSIKGATEDTPVNTWQDPFTKKTIGITSNEVLTMLRKACDDGGGQDVFGYKSSEVGTHSIRSGAAMALFLAHESVLKIMILGRWSSDAFLVYIRAQVLEWTTGMSKSMIKHLDYTHVEASITAAQANTEEFCDGFATKFTHLGGDNSNVVLDGIHLTH
jgi:hypothetical protein